MGTRVYAQVTDACDAGCAHCGFSCETKGRGLLAVAKLEVFLDDLASQGLRVSHLALTGGEPMLFPDRVFALAERVHARGIRMRLITNASWAKSSKEADRLVDRLRQAGVSGLWIGTGHFHDARIPAQRTTWAVDAALGVGMACHLNHVYLHPLSPGMRGKGLCWVDGRIEADMRTGEAQEGWAAQADDLLSHGWARLWDRGRASALIDELGPELSVELRRDLTQANRGDPLPPMRGLAWDGRPFEGELF
ncbi:MAG: radical SAM protein [Deltaproteobacteria bacterium]|nr:radical SAM protein [Deltaproteobacteria bacterium]